MMNYWHMQLHPSNDDLGQERQLLEEKALIGLGEFETDQIGRFKSEMHRGDIVAIKNGQQLIALVVVVGDYEYSDNPGDLDWFEHRRKVKVLGWNTDGLILKQHRGTLNICRNLNAPTSKVIISWHQSLMRSVDMDKKKKILKEAKQIIFSGPPGTGKTYTAKKVAAMMLDVNDGDEKGWVNFEFQMTNNGESIKAYTDGAWGMVQFHPSYNYEDFVRGIQAKTDDAGNVSYNVQNRIFAAMCEAASQVPDKPFVLIIDEINRANVSSVLGELIYALEYRGESISTPYALGQGATITVPSNLYIIGTMNTADRSIGHIDYAVRRRFAFEKMLPSKESLDSYYSDMSIDDVAISAKSKFDQVQRLFDSNECLAPEYSKEDVAVGHTYFMAESVEVLELKMKYQVFPLLEEYVKDGVLLEQTKRKIHDIFK